MSNGPASRQSEVRSPELRSPELRSIVLPTDLAAGSEQVFAHGLAIALHARARLHLVHVHTPDKQALYWNQLPSVRQLLMRWRRIGPEAGPEEIAALGVRVLLDDLAGDDAAHEIAQELRNLRPDLLVLGTHRRKGFEKLFYGSVAERIFRASRQPTLFLGLDDAGWVDRETGWTQPRRVVVPTGQDVPPHRALDLAAAWLPLLGRGPFEITLVHAGAPSTLPPPALPSGFQGTVRQANHNVGDIIAAVLAEIELDHADLVIMATHGRDSWLDDLVGSKTEQLVRWTKAPVLVLPLPPS